MSTSPLNYLPPNTPQSPRRWQRLPWKTPTAILALTLIAVATWSVTVRKVESRMDAVTGSTTWKTVWPFGITSGPRTEVSSLETRLKTSNIAWTPSWQFLHNTHRNLFGVATCYECGTAPA